MTGTLYLVATPIGNLADITIRAVDILKHVDFVICEDTRHSGQLLKHFGVSKPLRTLHDHSPASVVQTICSELKTGASAALISDAGTPLISDPGFPLVREAVRAGVRVESIPGPTALISALIVSGLPMHEFTFVGYLPQKEKARCNRLKALASEQRTLIFYESPHRIVKMLKNLADCFGDRNVSVSRELTKKFEETVRGTLAEVSAQVAQKKILGEWVVVVEGKPVNPKRRDRSQHGGKERLSDE